MARTFVARRLLAVVSLAAHLAVLPPTLEDLDSVNFALGVRQFDVAHHQPHPPGYPIFIALGKLGTAALARAGIAMPEVRGLAIWSAIAAGVLPLLFFAFFRRLLRDESGDVADRRAADRDAAHRLQPALLVHRRAAAVGPGRARRGVGRARRARPGIRARRSDAGREDRDLIAAVG